VGRDGHQSLLAARLFEAFLKFTRCSGAACCGFACAHPLTARQHEFAGFADVLSHELAVPLNDVAADDHGLHVGGASAQNHRGDAVAVTIEMRRSHVDDRDVSLLARRKAADFFLHIPYASAINRCEPQHVPLMERDGRNLLSSCQRRALALERSAASPSRISEKMSVPQLQMVSTPKPHRIPR
jgi:hypothetical protein